MKYRIVITDVNICKTYSGVCACFYQSMSTFKELVIYLTFLSLVQSSSHLLLSKMDFDVSLPFFALVWLSLCVKGKFGYL